MSFARTAAALLIGSLIAAVPVGPTAGGAEQADSSRPTVTILRPSAGVRVGGTIPYGAIRVRAHDRDVGTSNGDGIRHVRVTIRDVRTRDVVRRKVERWRPYEFGFVLEPGRYRVTARARSTNAAGGTWSQTSIPIVVDGSEPLAMPRSVVRRENAADASLRALNRLRENAGAGPVSMGVKMSDFAYGWSLEMSASGLRHSKGGYAENIAWHSDDEMTATQAAERFNAMWRNSSGHYSNMTNPAHTRVGIGLYRHASGWWATHVFD